MVTQIRTVAHAIGGGVGITGIHHGPGAVLVLEVPEQIVHGAAAEILIIAPVALVVVLPDHQAGAVFQLLQSGNMAAALDALYAPLEDIAVHVEQLLMDGADFDDLMQAYGADEFMLHEPYSANGYIVQPDSNLFVKEFADACFALEEIGDISDVT